MQIQKISLTETNRYNTSFGYNAEANAKLIHYLESQKRNKGFYKYLKNMLMTTNEAEKDLRAAEKKNTTTI